jgi:hypothetical protein
VRRVVELTFSRLSGKGSTCAFDTWFQVQKRLGLQDYILSSHQVSKASNSPAESFTFQ